MVFVQAKITTTQSSAIKISDLVRSLFLSKFDLEEGSRFPIRANNKNPRTIMPHIVAWYGSSKFRQDKILSRIIGEIGCALDGVWASCLDKPLNWNLYNGFDKSGKDQPFNRENVCKPNT